MNTRESLIDRIISDFPILSNYSKPKKYTFQWSSKTEGTSIGRIYAFYNHFDDCKFNPELLRHIKSDVKTSEDSTLAEIFSYNPNYFEAIYSRKEELNSLPKELLIGPIIDREENLNDPTISKDYSNIISFFRKLINKYYNEDIGFSYLSLGTFNETDDLSTKSLFLAQGLRYNQGFGVKVNGNFFKEDYKLKTAVDLIFDAKEKLDKMTYPAYTYPN